MKLTASQKHARKVFKEAARRMIQELDSRDWTNGCIEFRADFHLGCIQDKGTYRQSWPIYVPIRSSSLTSR